MEIAFVTTGKRHISIDEEYAIQVRKITREMVRDNWKSKDTKLNALPTAIFAKTSLFAITYGKRRKKERESGTTC